MNKSHEPIYRRNDGVYIIQGPAGEYACAPRALNPDGYASQEDVEAYLVEHPEALVPEPLPPEPTPEELAAHDRARALADLAALDARAIRPLLAIAADTATDADHKKISELEAEAAKLRKGL